MKASKRPYNFLVIGPQGSGKGTQAELLAAKFNLKHLSTGNMLRRLARHNKKIALTLNQGRFVPWRSVLEMTKKAIKAMPGRQGLVFDGQARQLIEANAFLKTLNRAGRRLDKVFLIDIPVKEAVRRLSERRQCDRGHIFRIGVNLKPGQKKCPGCGRPLFQRDDDRPAAIRERLKDYRQKTLPAIDYFKEQGLLVKINGAQPIEKVFADILKSLK